MFFFLRNSMSKVNRDIQSKHIPVVINAINKLSKRVMNSGIKQLVIKNVTFKTDAYWDTSDPSKPKWQTSSTDATPPARIQYNSDIVWFPDDVCDTLRRLMANNSLTSIRINIPINEDILAELADRPDHVNHYIAEYTNGIYSYVFQFAGCKWDFINFRYITADGLNVNVTVNVKSESQRDQMEENSGNITDVNPGFRITDVNRNYPNGGQYAFDLDGVQSIVNGGVRMAIPKDPIDVIIEYRE